MDAQQLWETTLDPQTRLLKSRDRGRADGLGCDGDAYGKRRTAAQGVYL